MKKVTSQEFLRYTSKYIKELPITVTVHGEDSYVLVSWKDYIIGHPVGKPQSVKWTKTPDPEVWVDKHLDGCIKVTGAVLCKAHGRM